MQFCQEHWSLMRQAVDDRAMSNLVARDGHRAVENLSGELSGAPASETFDPLMSMHWAIANNVMRIVADAGGSPLALLAEHSPANGHGCPLCYINVLHRDTCQESTCGLDKERGYDWMVARSADDALERARSLGLMPAAS